MKQLIFNFIFIAIAVVISGSCSRSSKSYSYIDFDGRIFISDKKIESELPQITFNKSKVKAENFKIFSNDHVFSDFVILPKTASPSGKPTICVNNKHYFIIESPEKLIYRNYFGYKEVKIVFRSK